ncbi:MAG: TonB-dependent receptor [candidate division KSB1 bacterium]|nr:TonB-dependent receptor [candidate division KSB1 bacterium]
MMRLAWLAIIGFVLGPWYAFAGTTGKIAGYVRDAESGSGLPGVNVVVEGTDLGAATDANGYYVILNVPPGHYNVSFRMIGYATHVEKDVKVEMELTTTIDVELRPVVIAGEEVVVVAERPVVQKDVSASQMNVEAAVIEKLPVKTVDEVITLQAGIERGSRGFIVRGGAANQTVFLVDGLSLNDERSNFPYTAVGLSALREIKIQTGGFNAEYGNLRSGLINVVTREGDRKRYMAVASIQYRPPAPKHFGPSLYDPNSYFNRPYLDDAVCWYGTNVGEPFTDVNSNGRWDPGEPFRDLNGDGVRSYWDEYTRRQYPNFEGWYAVSEATMQDDDPTNDLTPEAAQRLFRWQRRRQGDITKPDFVVDVGFGGPLPLIGRPLGNLRFYLSHFREREMFIFPLSRDSYFDHHTQLKLTSDITSSTKMIATLLYGEIHSVSPYNWKTTPTGYVLRTPYEVANLLNSSYGSAILYMPGFYSPSSIFRTMIGLKITHVVSPKTFYEFSLQHNINRYKTYQMATRDTTRRYEVVPGFFVDEAPFGYWGYSVNGIDGMIMGGWMNLGRDRSVNTTTSFRFDLTSQLNPHNQVKAGIQVVYNDYRIRSSTYSPSMPTWTRSMKYDVFPYRIGVYVQDKLEFQGFIANVGLRLDYSDPNTEFFALDPYAKYFKAGYGKAIELEAPREKAEPSLTLSPRLGVSHPITESSKLYFNYGHFRSEPASSYRFRLQRESNGLVTYVGNPWMHLEKTVAYEVGYAQSLFEEFLLNIAAYYKDVTNQPGWIYYQSIDNSVQYYKAASNNYQDIRGFEITLTKRSGRWVTGFINYTYDVRTSGYFGLTAYYEDPNKQREYLRLNPYQEKPRPRPYARANITIQTPEKWGPFWLGHYILGDWRCSFLAEWYSGRYETYNPNSIPGVVDNVRWKDWYNVDMRLSKAFKMGRAEVQAYVDVRNLFNFKFLNYAAFSDRYDYLDYLESLNFEWEEGVEKGHDRIGEYRPDDVPYDPLEPNPNNDPEIRKRNEERKRKKSYIDMPNIRALTFLNPKDVVFGIKINF